MKKILLSLFFLLFLLAFPVHTHASEYFDREYNVSYTVKETGTTHVSLTVTLTNKTSDYYASSDIIQLGFETLTNVTAQDPSGVLQPKITRTAEGNTVELNFRERVVGRDKALVFNVSFDTSDVAHQQGSIWEITIPGIANPDEFTRFNVEVSVPESFGEPSYIKPSQADKSLTFTKDQLGTSGISIAYGEVQYYSLDLIYHLQNRNLFPIRTEIALPPSTAYQEVSIDSIEPQPKNVVVDKDGNWLAEYVLLPSEKIDVAVKGRVRVILKPSAKEILSDEQRKLYTRERTHWEVNNTHIKELAQKLKTPEAIYEYVISTLTYDFDRVTDRQPRLGAVAVLANPESAVCLEFADLFIAIARAAGIPTREVNGYAYTQNQKQRPLSLSEDILHAWPEYYDSSRQQWIMVDPTWGNTTGGVDYFKVFDLDHIVFVRKGEESTYPIPAGGYKFSGDEQKKDVNVSLADAFEPERSTLDITPQMDKEFLSGFPIGGTLLVKNRGSTLSQAQSVKIRSLTLNPGEQYIHIPVLPPYASVELPLSFSKTPFLTNTTHTFAISLPDSQIEHTIQVLPFSFKKEQIIGVISVISAIIIFIIARKTWRLRVFR